jgi:protein TonB
VTYIYAVNAPKMPLFSDPIEISVIPPMPQKETAEDHSKAIVQKSEGQEADQAKKNAYLSDRTRVVNEERSAKNAGEVTSRSKTTAKTTAEKAQNSKPVSLSDLGLKISPKTDTEYKDQRNWAKSELGESIQGGQYIKGMKEGEVSALNTKEFVFYSYFERVRRQLDQAWQPMVRANIEKIVRTGRRLASDSDYVTRTLVVLNLKGDIVKIQVLEESGTMDLDQAAVNALNRAGPYPNPPKGLVDEMGLVKIRWDFMLKT